MFISLQRVVAGLFDGVTTSQIDELASETAAGLSSRHLDWGVLASRLWVSNIHKSTPATFTEAMQMLYNNGSVNKDDGNCSKDGNGSKDSDNEIRSHSLVSTDIYDAVTQCPEAQILNSAINNQADYAFSFFGLKTLQRSYLLKVNDKTVERPQYMFMRVALGIHGIRALDRVLETYRLLSARKFTHASPTLFSAGTNNAQLASCFLTCMKSDSIEGIYDTLKQCAIISKHSGGIGLSISNIRASGAKINGTNGTSTGIIPMIRVFNATARYVDQGGGKRKGGIALYIEPWHADIFSFLDLRKNNGNEDARARDIFTALWMCDLFMRRVEQNEHWTLMCPSKCPGLDLVWGDEFEKLYESYEQQGLGESQCPARDVWSAILTSQIETGTPYMLYKDACNRLSNQKNVGTIRSSNLCTEIIEYSSADETAVCNLASIALPQFVDSTSKIFDHDEFSKVVGVVTRNLNRILDINHYPCPEAKKSNLRHRPIGIGVQGLADVFMLMGLVFGDAESRQVNIDIFETLYYAALDESCRLAEANGAPYDSYAGSPLSQGILHFDQKAFPGQQDVVVNSSRHDWTGLRARIAKHGVMNSLLIAPMPTASTSQILGFNECFEPYTSNIYTRRVISGEYIIVNPHLFRDLSKLGLWSESVKDQILRDNGSIRNIDKIPMRLKEVIQFYINTLVLLFLFCF